MNVRPLLDIAHLSVTLPERGLFEDLSFSLAAGEILAIVGANGCGKSTLLEVVVSQYRLGDFRAQPEELAVRGSVTLAAGAELSRLPQQVNHTPARGSAAETACSDGERQKAALATVFATPADLYLFDEPTNYLDIEGIVWLESELLNLARRGRGVVIVSHDRRLINNVADRTLYFTPNGIFQTRGGYSSALSLAQSTYDSKRHEAAVIGNKIRQLESEARSRMGWAASKEKSKRGAGKEKPHIAKMAAKMAARAKTAQAKAGKEIERLKKVKPFVPKAVQLRLPEYEVRHRTVCSLEEVTFAYPDAAGQPTLHEISLGLSTTDRICILGGNGSGKSTLLKLVAGRLRPSGGRLRRNEGVHGHYLPQGLRGYFSGRTLLDGFAGVAADEATVRTLLGGVMIRGDKVHQALDGLSPGELTRAALVKAMVARAEFLLFDEPTSHLDIESVEVLEQALRQFPGGYAVISHDRSFVEAVADSLYVIEQGRLRLA